MKQLTNIFHNNLKKDRQKKFISGLVIGSLADKKGTIDVPIAEHPVKKGLMRFIEKEKNH